MLENLEQFEIQNPEAITGGNIFTQIGAEQRK